MTTKLFAGKLTGLHCPECKYGKQVIRQNRTTLEFFVACNAYPECKWSANLPEDQRLRALGQRGLFDEDES